MREKAERFAPGFGKKHKAQADADYLESVVAGNSQGNDPTVAPVDPPDGGDD